MPHPTPPKLRLEPEVDLADMLDDELGGAGTAVPGECIGCGLRSLAAQCPSCGAPVETENEHYYFGDWHQGPRRDDCPECYPTEAQDADAATDQAAPMPAPGSAILPHSAYPGPQCEEATEPAAIAPSPVEFLFRPRAAPFSAARHACRPECPCPTTHHITPEPSSAEPEATAAPALVPEGGLPTGVPMGPQTLDSAPSPVPAASLEREPAPAPAATIRPDPSAPPSSPSPQPRGR